MKTKNFLVTWGLTFVLVFGLNGVFHSGIAAPFFDNNLQSIASVKKMKDSNPLPVALLDLIIVFTMTYLITNNKPSKIKIAEGAIAGGLINLATSGAWNLANTAMFDWPLTVTLGDMAWHTALDCAGGSFIAWMYNKRALKNAV